LDAGGPVVVLPLLLPLPFPSDIVVSSCDDVEEVAERWRREEERGGVN